MCVIASLPKFSSTSRASRPDIRLYTITNSSDPMNNQYTGPNWDELRTKVSAFDIPVYPFESCTNGDLIGSGAAMAVFEGKFNASGEEKDIALKKHMKLNQRRVLQRDLDQVLRELRHEIMLMKRLKFHPNIVQIIGVTFEGNKPVLLVELGDHTLDAYLYEQHHKGKTVAWFEKIMLCMDVLHAVQGLHAAGIVHGDLKGENILLFIKPTGTLIAKISDFGFSSTLSSSKREIGGTPQFMAPECMRAHPQLSQFYRLQTQDIFGLGLVTYQIANNGAIPYISDEEDSDVLEARATDPELNTVLAQLPPNTPAGIRQVIVITTKFMPTDRASLDEVEQILRHLLSALPSQPLQGNQFDTNDIHILDEIPKRSLVSTRLKLKDMRVDEEGFRALAESLKQFNTSIELNFYGNKIDEKGAYHLAEILKQDFMITRLELGGNFIGTKGAQALAESLKGNTTLTHLYLGDNSIGGEGAQALAESLKGNTTLTHLYLSRNKIGTKGVQSLAESLKGNTTLIRLNLRQNSIDAEEAQALAELLKGNTALSKLDLNYNSIGGKGAQALAESLKGNTTLTHLHLGGNKIGTKGAQTLAESLKGNTTLCQLDLRNNLIGGEGVQALVDSLKGNTTLTQLGLLSWVYSAGSTQQDLCYNSIGDEGAQPLAKLLNRKTIHPQLSHHYNYIGDEGAQSLAKSLRGSTTLTQLGHHWNYIGDEALKGNKTSIELNLRF